MLVADPVFGGDATGTAGATYSTDPDTHNCYAEFGMEGPNDNSAWQTCAFPSAVGICEFRQGDGVGGSEERIGDAPNTMACVDMVLSERPEANVSGCFCWLVFWVVDDCVGVSVLLCMAAGRDILEQWRQRLLR